MMEIPILLFVLLLIGMFASGYGFGNYVEQSLLETHGEEIDALTETIDELYVALEDLYLVLTGDTVSGEEARLAAERALFLLTVVKSPTEVEAA